MRYPILMAAALLAPAAAHAGPEPTQPPERIRSVALAARETCPPAVGDEVVVCYRADEPYRIPKTLRKSEIAARTTSWVNRVATMDEVGRVAGGLPNTCSPVGTGGQSGCTQSMLRAWAADRRAAQSLP